MTAPLTDLLGQSVEVGDRIAVAFRSGNSSELRIGKVISIEDKPESDSMHARMVMTVEWTHGSEGKAWLPKGPTKITEPQRDGRIVKLSS